MISFWEAEMENTPHFLVGNTKTAKSADFPHIAIVYEESTNIHTPHISCLCDVFNRENEEHDPQHET